MTRETCQAYELTDEVTYAFNNGRVQKIVKSFTVFDRTTLIDSNGDSWRIVSSTPIELATEAEVAEYEREQDRHAVAGALLALGRKIVERGLPVPPDGKGIVVSLYLAEDSDVEPWANWLQARPRQGTAQPLIQADAEGVEINVYRSGEFGPDLADAALAESVEHRDSVGAFPVVPSLPSYDPHPTLLMRPGDRTSSHYASYAKSLDKSNPGWWNDDLSRMAGGLAFEAQSRRNEEDTAGPHGGSGWEFSDGHRPPVDDEAMRADRYNGEG